MENDQKNMLIGLGVGTIATLGMSYMLSKTEEKKVETPKVANNEDYKKKNAELTAQNTALTKKFEILEKASQEKVLNIPTFFPLENVKKDIDVDMRHTKIICTLGPACSTKEKLLTMIDAGLNVARLNFSHGDHESHGKMVETLKSALVERPDKRVALMLDTKGPEIRTGNLKDGKNIDLEMGQDLEITSEDYSTFQGDNTKIACSYPGLAKSVKLGQTIFIADGSLTCKVKQLKEKSVMVEVMNKANIGQKKNMNLPGVVVDLPILSEQDTKDIKIFGAKHNIDMVAASFVQSKANVEHIRGVLKDSKQVHVHIISKIENQAGLDNLDDIIASGDGIMVARGDLGMEIAPEKVFVAQKWMIKKCNEAGKPVQTATQMLESMIQNPRPTRAEASDVANAVLDGTDAIMLSGESANGAYPKESVTMLCRTACEAERCIDFEQLNHKLNAKVPESESIAASVVRSQLQNDAKFIICHTEMGSLPRFISKYRPSVNIIAMCSDEHMCANLNTVRNVFPVKVASAHEKDYASQVKEAIVIAKRSKVVAEGKYIEVSWDAKKFNLK